MHGCCESVTVWRREGNKFKREVIGECRWRRRAERRLEGAGFVLREVVSIIIAYKPGFAIAPGDLAALGEHELEITVERPYRESDVRAMLELVTVQRVSYNIGGRAAHVRLECV